MSTARCGKTNKVRLTKENVRMLGKFLSGKANSYKCNHCGRYHVISNENDSDT